MAHFSRLARYLRGILLTAPWLAYLLLADVALSALVPLKLLLPDLVYNMSSAIAQSVWTWIQLVFEKLNNATITFSGDRLPVGESAIVVANHVSWTDFYMIQALARQANMLGRCRYLAKVQLRLVPFLGWGLWAMGMPMVSRNWIKDRGELERVFAGIVKRRWPTWLISFSEATRFTEAKYNKSMLWCKEVGKPQPKYLLYPRTKGFVATVQHLRKAPQVKAVYDVTIAYQKGEKFQDSPTMWESLYNPDLSHQAGYKFHVHTRRFLLESLPQHDEELAGWLERRWVEKGEWLEAKKEEWAATERP